MSFLTRFLRRCKTMGKQESFDVYLPTAIEALDDPKYVELYKAFLETQENYTFCNITISCLKTAI